MGGDNNIATTTWVKPLTTLRRATTQTPEPRHANTNVEGDDSCVRQSRRTSRLGDSRSVGLETMVFRKRLRGTGAIQHTQERFTPEAVEFLNGRHIVEVSAGIEHNGHVDGHWRRLRGYNDSGQCGVGTTGRVPALAELRRSTTRTL